MARNARVVVPGIPHHVTQRGSRRQPVFFKEIDRLVYRRILKKECEQFGVQIWAYCLMENHIHLIAVPEKDNSLAKALGAAHQRYSRYINRREGWTGFLWQGRFASFSMDENYLLAAVRYVERNPVEAKLVSRAEDYPWSSARAHVLGDKDFLLSPCFLSETIVDWAAFLFMEGDKEAERLVVEHSRAGLPLGDKEFIQRIQSQVGRPMVKQRSGPKRTIHSVPVTKCK